ncbi:MULTISPECIES: hypothetical protein [unclassified Beijerinckia]|uniref:hypothetical protein n=1 Tax=unclassified Beijerinckia TaxID=2638183 RepID=UPI001114918B|nr:MULTISPECIES: hypothetical protein [unclassified Beijerinckia]
MSVDEYLGQTSCPYPRELRVYLNRFLSEGPVSGGDRVPVFEGAKDKFEVVLEEVEATIEMMKKIELDVSMSTDTDPSDRIQLVKAKTSLLEKWVSLKERVYTLRETVEFQQIVFGVMDDMLDVNGRTQFRNRLRNLQSVADLKLGAGAESKLEA